MHRTTAISAGADKRIMNSRPAYDTHQEILHTKTCLGDTADKHGRVARWRGFLSAVPQKLPLLDVNLWEKNVDLLRNNRNEMSPP